MRLINADCLCEEYADRRDSEFEAAIKQKMEEYEPYWKKVIVIYALN